MIDINQLSSKIIKAAIDVHKAVRLTVFADPSCSKDQKKKQTTLSLSELERLKGAGESQKKNLSPQYDALHLRGRHSSQNHRAFLSEFLRGEFR